MIHIAVFLGGVLSCFFSLLLINNLRSNPAPDGSVAIERANQSSSQSRNPGDDKEPVEESVAAVLDGPKGKRTIEG